MDAAALPGDKGRPKQPSGASMNRLFTILIVAAMVLGVAVGWGGPPVRDARPTAKAVAGNLSIVTDVFLRLIKMIIAPLVFSTLVAGIAHMEDAADHRPGGRQDPGLVHLRLAGLADHRPDHGPPAPAGRRACT